MQGIGRGSYRNILRYYTILGFIVLAICTATTIILVKALDREKLASVTSSNAAAGRVAQLYVERLLINIEALSKLAGYAFLRNRSDPIALHQDLKRLHRRQHATLQISIVDLRGSFVASDLSSVSGLDLSDREHIKYHLMHPSSTLFISRPLVGRVSKKRSINITRLLYDAASEPYGIAVVSLDLAEMEHLVKDLAVGEGSIVTLFLSDGTLLARSTDNDRHQGKQFTNLLPLVKAANGVLFNGQFFRKSLIDGRMRVFDARSVGDARLLVVHGTLLAQYEHERLLAVSLAIIWLITLLILFIGGRVFLLNHFKKQAEVEMSQLQELEARQAKELLDTAFNAAGVFIVVLNEQGQVHHANEVAACLLQSLSENYELPKLLSDLEQNRGGKVRRFVSRVPLAGGRKVVNWTVTPADWLKRGFHVAIGFDRSELEAKEQALYQKGRLVLLGEMSTGLAHEMAQPLSVINLAAAMIRNPQLTEKEKDEARARLLLGAERVRRTVDRMKVFARWNGSESRPESFELIATVNSVIALTRAELTLLNIELVSELPRGEIVVIGNEAGFEQVLLNLLLNARDALKSTTTTRQKVITMRVEQLSSGGAKVRVIDTGPGIPDVVKPRIFEPFFTTKADGTGLGLALSFGIMQEMNGAINIVDRAIGTEFEIVLPGENMVSDLEVADHA